MTKREYYSYQEVRELLKKIAKDEFDDKIKCNRCKRLFDPEKEIMYFICIDEKEQKEEKGFFVCFDCRDKIEDVRVEQLI